MRVGTFVVVSTSYGRFLRASEFMYWMSSGSRASGVIPNAVLNSAIRSAAESFPSGSFVSKCATYEQKASFFMVARNETKTHACAYAVSYTHLTLPTKRIV